MKIEINTEEIIEKIDIRQLIADGILSDSRFEDIADDILENKEMKDIIYEKIHNIIEEYISTDKFKEYIIEKFSQDFDDSDLLDDDSIIDMVKDLLKSRLMGRY